MVYRWINNAQQLLYPPLCLLCGSANTADRDICNACLAELPHNINCCSICALPLDQHTLDRPVCGRCLRLTPVFDRCHTAFSYLFPISSMISEFKFAGKLQHGRLLTNLLISHIESSRLDLPELIIPVPLHRSRLLERGFNQAIELARPVGHHFNIPVDIASCIRTRATEAQTTLDKNRRRKNIRGAFTVTQRFKHSHVAVLDDVVTTGGTVGEMARILKREGIQRVDIWALARTAEEHSMDLLRLKQLW